MNGTNGKSCLLISRDKSPNYCDLGQTVGITWLSDGLSAQMRIYSRNPPGRVIVL